MRHTSLLFALLILAASSIAVAGCTTDTAEATETAVLAEVPMDTVAYGKYLVEILGCHDCHSPKKMGPQGPELIAELMLSGYPADRPIGKVATEALNDGWALFNGDLTMGVGPWGATFAANITSDESGIGTWSLEQFKRAFTQGRSKGLENGRMLLPPMPWFNYKGMKDSDVAAIYSYLKSTNPVRNVVPAPIAPDALTMR